MNRTEIVIATAVILFAAFALGWVMRWVVTSFTHVTKDDMSDLEEMAHQLHEAEDLRDQAITYAENRERDLSNMLTQKEAELAAAMDGLREARAEVSELRAYLERITKAV
ncbi:hypothetical protein [Tropicimonas sp. S265A]|uniref:hypothetical protein n=1 Tax=Tropicimonas sp. S265A TaxID=3415134 RepID=UPI003C7D5D74